MGLKGKNYKHIIKIIELESLVCVHNHASAISTRKVKFLSHKQNSNLKYPDLQRQLV